MSLDLRTQMKIKMSSSSSLNNLSGKEKAKYLKSLKEKEKEKELEEINQQSKLKNNQIKTNISNSMLEISDNSYNSYNNNTLSNSSSSISPNIPSTTQENNNIEINNSLPVGFFDDVNEEMTVRGINVVEEVKKQENQNKEQLQMFFEEVDNIIPVDTYSKLDKRDDSIDEEESNDDNDNNDKDDDNDDDIVQAAYETKIGTLMFLSESNKKRELINDINYLEAEKEVNEVLAQDHDIIENFSKDSSSSIQDIISSSIAKRRKKNTQSNDLILDPLNWNSRSF